VKRLLPLVLVMAAFTVVGCKPNKPPASQPGMTSETAPPPQPQPYQPPADNTMQQPEPAPAPAPMSSENTPTHHTTHHHMATATAHRGKYIVKKGDTLSKIAHAHHVSLKRIEAANPKVDPNKIHVGQTIMIP
jgi:nucleoid-associated protein YgaU